MVRKIVITSIGSLVGQNILDALEGRRENLFVVGTNSLAEAPNNFRCDRAVLMPPAASGQDYKSRLLALFESESPDLVIPARDDDILVLAEMAVEHPEWAARLLVGSPEMARVMDDKVASHAFAKVHGLPFVETVSSDADDAWPTLLRLRQRYGFPWLAKPRNGNGSRGILILVEDEQLQRVAAKPGLAIQPMLDPPDIPAFDPADGLPFFWGVTDTRLYGVQCLIDRQGDIRQGMGFMVTMVAGRCEHMQRCDDAGLIDAAGRFARQAAACGWRGPMNMQFKNSGSEGYLAIELNGRFTGGTSARGLFGHDEVAECLNEWLGSDTVRVRPFEPGVFAVTKSLCDFSVAESSHRTLSENGIWTRSC